MKKVEDKNQKDMKKGLSTAVKVILLLAGIIFLFLVFLNISSCTDGFTDEGEMADEYEISLQHLDLVKRKKVWNIFRTGCDVDIGKEKIFITRERDPITVEYETVRMGRYPQYKTEEDPIEWLIIDNDGDRTLLLSKYCLDAARYCDKVRNISWEKSYLRRWLNEDFYNRAFNQQEQKEIKLSDIESDFYIFRAYEGQSDIKELPSKVTKDRVFILDPYEKLIYLTLTGNDYQSEPTEYARQKVRKLSSDGSYSDDVKSDWSRFGRVPNITCQVFWSFGLPYEYDYCLKDLEVLRVRDIDTALYVRPAMWVNTEYVESLKNQE